MMTFIIVDDHPIVCRGLTYVLEPEFAPVEMIEAHTGQDAIEAVQQHRCDAVVLAINLPDMNGIEVLREIKVLCPRLPVIIHTLYPGKQYAVQAFKEGASGYLTKEGEPEELILAVKKVLEGGTYVSLTCGEQLANMLGANKGLVPHKKLSNRELEVLRLIAKGQSLTQISVQLSLSVKTIGTYQTRIKEKLKLTTIGSLIRYAIDNHLVE